MNTHFEVPEKLEKRFEPISISGRKNSDLNPSGGGKKKKIAESIITSESTEGSKNISSSPKAFDKLFIEIPYEKDEKKYPYSGVNTLRE